MVCRNNDVPLLLFFAQETTGEIGIIDCDVPGDGNSNAVPYDPVVLDPSNLRFELGRPTLKPAFENLLQRDFT